MATLETPAVAAARPRLSHRKLIRWTILLTIVVAAVVFGLDYWRHARTFVSTDNAYINANTVEIAAQVSGVVTQVYVRDNQHVEAATPLFDIDSRPFQVALDKA